MAVTYEKTFEIEIINELSASVYNRVLNYVLNHELNKNDSQLLEVNLLNQLKLAKRVKVYIRGFVGETFVHLPDGFLSVSTIRRLETKSDAAHSLEKLMALTLGMKLFPDLSFDLIDKSGTNFRNDVLYHTGYKMVLRNFYHLGAFECNELAKSLGLPEFLGK